LVGVVERGGQFIGAEGKREGARRLRDWSEGSARGDRRVHQGTAAPDALDALDAVTPTTICCRSVVTSTCVLPVARPSPTASCTLVPTVVPTVSSRNTVES
jgi:hypothetical protein